MPATASAGPARRAFRTAASAARCPKLPVHAAFAQPGQILVEAVEMPDGAEFLTHRPHAGRAAGRASTSGRAAPRSCSAATSAFATRSSMARRCRPATGKAPTSRDADRPGLPALRARRLPRPRRAAGDAAARARRDGDRAERLRFPVAAYADSSASRCRSTAPASIASCASAISSSGKRAPIVWTSAPSACILSSTASAAARSFGRSS